MRLALALFAVPLLAQTYDVVIANGRVIDPATNLDGVRHIGVLGGRIAAVSTTPLAARTTIEAKGLVVAPGFIDLHSHGQTAENYGFKARDGVTTALELEVGVHPAAAWYAEREGRALINYGASSGDIPARIAVMHDSGTLLPRDRAVERAATAGEFREVLDRVGRGLDEGALRLEMDGHMLRAGVLLHIAQGVLEDPKEQKLGLRAHLVAVGVMHDDIADLLSGLGASGLAHGDDLPAKFLKMRRQADDLRRLAAPLRALEGDEFARDFAFDRHRRILIRSGPGHQHNWRDATRGRRGRGRMAGQIPARPESH